MSAAFARLPVRVLWRLSKSEVPDQDAIAALNLANNTKVSPEMLPYNSILYSRLSMLLCPYACKRL